MTSISSNGIFSSIALAAGLALCAAGAAGAQETSGAKPVLTVYTYDSFIPDWGPGPQIKTAFEKTCGCELKFVGLGDGVAILNRLKLEGASSQADIALGMTTDLIPEAKATGLFADAGIDQSALDVPTGFSDPVFVPYDYSYLAVIYDTEAMKNPPKSLDELVNGDPDQKIALQDPRTSTPGLGFLLWMKDVYGEEAGAQWAKLSDRILTITPGWSEAYGLFTKGEVPMVLSYTTSPAYHMIEENTERYRAAPFAEGQYLQVEVAGILKNAAHPELAKEFMAFMLTHDFQDIIPTGNWAYPVIDGVALPPAFDKLVNVSKPLEIDPTAVAEHRRDWTQEWLRSVGR